MGKLKVLELFGGIGSCSKALERLGIEHEVVDYVEIDKFAVKSYNAMHGTNYEPQDICEWNKDIEVDLIMHGSPCQDFSLAGKQAGGDEGSGTRSSLMYETIRIVEKLKPKYVIWENVKNLLSKKHIHNFNAYLETMEQLGYTNYYQVLNAKDYGIPQNRERVFTVSILKEKTIYDDYNSSVRKDQDTIGTLTCNCGSSAIRNGWKIIECEQNFTFPPKQELKIRLKDMLEDEVDEKYYLDKYLDKLVVKDKISENDIKIEATIEQKGWHRLMKDVLSKESICTCLNTMQGGNLEPKVLIKEATKKGYKEAYDGDSVNLAYPESETRRGRVGEQVSQTLQCNDNMGVVEKPKVIGGIGEKKSNKGTQWYQQDRIYDDKVAISVTTVCNPYYKNDLKIRKLTPKECFRLMGFDDTDFEKAEKVNSNTQLYKQAGNSIVVNVLEAIFKELL